MKDCVFIIQYSSNLDGSAISALMLANGFREAGWETVISFAFPGPIINKFEQAGHKTCIVRHKSWLRSTHLFRFAQHFASETPQSAHKFAKVIKEVKPSLVYINTAVSLSGALATKYRRIPLVWHLRELFFTAGGEMYAPSSLLPLIQASFLRLSNRVVVNSGAVAANMLRGGMKRVEIVPNAVDEAFFEETRSVAEARNALGIDYTGFVVGVPGTLRPKKGHKFFLRALAVFVKKRKNMRVVITGGGASEYRNKLEQLINKLNLREYVHFMGYVQDMPAFYRACDFICIPSVAESFGRTVIEAFATKTPVIASGSGGIEDLIEHRQTGLHVAYGDEEGLALAMENVYSDKSLYGLLQQNARQEAEIKYRSTVYQNRLSKIVAEVIAESQRK